MELVENKNTAPSLVTRVKTMLHVDFKRMFTQPFLYVVLLIAIAAPILILVMTTAVGGGASSEGASLSFSSVWDMIGSASSSSGASAMSMDMSSMMNINLLYFAIAVVVCVFVGADFRSGYCKNLFTVRSKKSDYVISKTLVCFVAGALLMIGFFVGSLIGGGVAGLSFALPEGVNIGNVICSLLAKIFLIPLFVSIFNIASVVAKDKVWLSTLLSLGIGMLFFMIVPMVTPLNSSILHVFMCLLGGSIFAIVFGFVSNLILQKTSLV